MANIVMAKKVMANIVMAYTVMACDHCEDRCNIVMAYIDMAYIAMACIVICRSRVHVCMCARMCARVHVHTHTFGRHAIAFILQVAGGSEEEEKEEGGSGDMLFEGTERCCACPHQALQLRIQADETMAASAPRCHHEHRPLGGIQA